MTDTTANETNVADISALSDAVRATQDMLVKFAETITNALTGPTTTAQPVKRGRGRPRKNPLPAPAAQESSIATPVAPTVQEAKSKEIHPAALQILERVAKDGRVRMSDLAKDLDMNRSLVHYHAAHLAALGKLYIVERPVNGVMNKVCYAPNRIVLRDN